MAHHLRTLRAVARKKAPSPLGALARGLAAGAVGSLAQSLFFKLTKQWAPTPTRLPAGVAKPEPEAKDESGLETVARRLTTGMMQRGPLDPVAKGNVGNGIHYAFGAVWGGLYGLWRESFRASSLGFGALVWMASDNLLLPLFRVSAWPNRYSLKEHHYALQAHLVYGLSTAAAYALLRNLGPVPLAALPAMAALQLRAWALRAPPAKLVQKVFAPSWTQQLVNPLLQKAALA